MSAAHTAKAPRLIARRPGSVTGAGRAGSPWGRTLAENAPRGKRGVRGRTPSGGDAVAHVGGYERLRIDRLAGLPGAAAEREQVPCARPGDVEHARETRLVRGEERRVALPPRARRVPGFCVLQAGDAAGRVQDRLAFRHRQVVRAAPEGGEVHLFHVRVLR